MRTSVMPHIQFSHAPPQPLPTLETLITDLAFHAHTHIIKKEFTPLLFADPKLHLFFYTPLSSACACKIVISDLPTKSYLVNASLCPSKISRPSVRTPALVCIAFGITAMWSPFLTSINWQAPVWRLVSLDLLLTCHSLQTRSPKPRTTQARINKARITSTFGFSVCPPRGLHQEFEANTSLLERNGRKTLTTVQGLPKKFDQKKILKVIKKKFGNHFHHFKAAIQD